MTAAILLVPFIFIRLFLFKKFNKNAYQRAQQFAPLAKSQKGYYIVYQISQVLLIICPVFRQVTLSSWLDFMALILYLFGLLIIYLAIIAFVKANENNFIQSGVYQVSRHPMYVGYFFYYFGMAVWMRDYLYLIVLIVFQICAHQIILAEEAWCEKEYGPDYVEYKTKVRRYL